MSKVKTMEDFKREFNVHGKLSKDVRRIAIRIWISNRINLSKWDTWHRLVLRSHLFSRE